MNIHDEENIEKYKLSNLCNDKVLKIILNTYINGNDVIYNKIKVQLSSIWIADFIRRIVYIK